MPDRLTPIPVSELGELKNLLSTDFPRHLGGYGLIATLEEWHRKTPVVEHIQIFTLNGDWRGDGLFVVTVSRSVLCELNESQRDSLSIISGSL